MAKAEDFLNGVADFGSGFASGWSSFEPIRKRISMSRELNQMKLADSQQRQLETEKTRLEEKRLIAKAWADYRKELRDEKEKARKDSLEREKAHDKTLMDQQDKENLRYENITALTNLRSTLDELSGVSDRNKQAALNYMKMAEATGADSKTVLSQVNRLLTTPEPKEGSGSSGSGSGKKWAGTQTALDKTASAIVQNDLETAYPGYGAAKTTLGAASKEGFETGSLAGINKQFSESSDKSLYNPYQMADAGMPDRLRNARQLVNSADSSLGMSPQMRSATVADSLGQMGMTGFLQSRKGGGAPMQNMPNQESDPFSEGGGVTDQIISELQNALDAGDITDADIEEAISMAESDQKNAGKGIDWDTVRMAFRKAQ